MKVSTRLYIFKHFNSLCNMQFKVSQFHYVRKFLAEYLLLYFFLTFSVAYCQNLTYVNQLYKTTAPSVVAIDVKPPENVDKKGILKKGIYYGTGFVISKNLVLTTRKVMQNELNAHCICYDNKIINAKVIAYDTNSPLTLLKINRSSLPPLLINKNYTVGKIVFSLGNTYGSIAKVSEISISKGAISGIYDFKRWGITLPDVIEIDCAINPGIYGGPIINIEGELVGAIFSGYTHMRVQGLAISVNAIEKFLTSYQTGKIPAPDKFFFLQTSPVYLGVKVIAKKRVTIVGIESDSPAEDGLLIGDQILDVNDYSVKSVKSLKRIIQTYFPGQIISFTVKRKHQIMVIPITLVARFMK